MILFVSLEYTLTQTGMGSGRVTLPTKGPIRGTYAFLIEKSIFIGYLFSVSVSGDSISHISLK